MTLTFASLEKFFSQFPNIKKFVLGFSGGLDSTILLYCMHKLDLPIQTIHINHHIQEESDQWELHCKRVCESWNIDYQVKHVRINNKLQESIEESARKARYTEFKKLVDKSTYLVTAHHMDDLAETLLLQLMRGAGPAGLAAMSIKQEFYGGYHLRPLLTYTKLDLEEFSKIHSLEWIDDPSNEELNFNRNYIRKKVLPVILRRWPAAVQTITRSAVHQADAITCLRELADLDLHGASTSDSRKLDNAVLQKLSDERLCNVLRGWVRNHGLRSPNKKIINHIVKDIVRCEEKDSSPAQTWADGEIRRYRQHIFLIKPLTSHDANQVFHWDINQPLHIKSINLSLNKSDLAPIKNLIPEDDEELTVRFRTGGERIKPFGKKHHRSLKNLFQESNIPPWERDRIPLIYYKNKLLYVFGHWYVSE